MNGMPKNVAKYYSRKEAYLICELCPHNCTIKEGKTGICGVRENQSGELISLNYGKVSAIHVDPIEKKPLYHYYPGKNILSVGSEGCNMQCSCCQNYNISQITYNQFKNLKGYTPDEIIHTAIRIENNIGIAYTYNEPTVWYEYMMDIAGKAKKHGLKNVVVSNGYINQEPLLDLLNHADAFNIDLKGFTNDFYKKVSKATLNPVLESLKQIRKHNRHLEITNLLIPSLNSDVIHFKQMLQWIVDNLGRDTILHISAYYPIYKMDLPPTSPELMEEMYRLASEKLDYVFTGNMRLKDYSNTYCSKCKTECITRNGYYVELPNLTRNGKCSICHNKIVEM